MKTNRVVDPTSLPVRRRHAKQERSAARQEQITQGAIAAIAEFGISAITHRRVARTAGVSLAATTYYYGTKKDIILDASHALLTDYVGAFRRFSQNKMPARTGEGFRDFVFRLLFRAAGRDLAATLAWCEIVVGAARDPDLRDLAINWFATLDAAWHDIAAHLGIGEQGGQVVSAIDAVIGFLFMILPLGLSESAVRALLEERQGDFSTGIAPARESPGSVAERPLRRAKKSADTRERILEAAVGLLIEDGGDNFSFRQIAERAGLTTAAPTYYFKSISALWDAARERLVQDSRHRYRTVMGTIDFSPRDLDELADLSATILIREATEYRDLSLANYPTYLQAFRDPHLRPGLAALNAEHHRRWSQILERLLGRPAPFDSALMQALFTGKLIRILATGGATADLSGVRAQFAIELAALAKGTHWSCQ